ncbi:DoxX family protein [Streptomyces spinoverrucosus]|uniref:DoxX family protein n=1 Tax=Streptomyces spinoverrucosus TaxID=284043 RepID=UPI0018C3AB36|nr:DoxX family protein [Streptomyces spinoverrucosus]MBG0857299.1 DoxX family protein [Streptomyces spinoverrucosus]
MNVALWAVAALLAVVFLGAGATKLAQTKEKLTASPSMAWANDFPPGAIKTIGLLEVLAAIGLVLPAAVDIAPSLVPLAASGLALTMFGAAITHGRRGELQPVVMNVVLLALAGFLAWGRFGPHAF